MDGLITGNEAVSVPVALVVIGRNEGERLQRCLESIPLDVPTVYVDSGSTDDSVGFAKTRGVIVVELDMSRGFTAARARNAGWLALSHHKIAPDMVQFIDGDCELQPHWITAGRAALLSEPSLAIVFGRRRERFPNASLYNRMCDEEWNVPLGLVNACGGDALVRMTALCEVEGYSDDLIAGEEPDMCLRLRMIGWMIRRIDAEMTQHDADIRTLGAWWRRTRRGGYAYMAHVLRHGTTADPGWRRQVRSIAFWGFAWPATGLAGSALFAIAGSGRMAATAAGVVVASYAIQVARVAMRRIAGGSAPTNAWQYGALVLLGKFAEFGGLLRCQIDRIHSRQAALMEYKGTK